MGRQVTAAELDVSVKGLGLPQICVADRRIVVAELTRRDLRETARVVARTSDAVWTHYVMGAGLAKTAANKTDWMPLILWALTATEADFPGKSKPSLKNRRHVMWALEELAEDIASIIPDHPVDWSDEDELNAEVVDDVNDLKRVLRGLNEDQWRDMIPDLHQEMDDPSLDRAYRKWMGFPVEDPSKEDLARMLGVEPAAPPQWTPPSVRPPEPVPPEVREHERQVEEEMMSQPDWQEMLQSRQEAPAEPPPAVPEPGEIVLEEPGQEPETEPQRIMREHEEELEQTRQEMFSQPSRYDVSMGGPAAGDPHEWATPAPTASRVPISVHPGFEGAKNPRSVKIWAEKEMTVENRKTGETGDIVQMLEGDRLAVRVRGEKVPTLEEQPVVWDAIDVRLSPEHVYPVEKLSKEEMASWRKTRDIAKKQKARDVEKQKKGGSGDSGAGGGGGGGATLVTVEDLIHEARAGDQGQPNPRRSGAGEVTAGPHDGGPAGRGWGDLAGRYSGWGAVGGHQPRRCIARFVLVPKNQRDAGHQREALAPLGQKELKRYLSGDRSFGVVSAYQGRSKSENQKAHGALMGELQRRGYSPGQIRPLMGQYFGEAGEMKAEKAYMVLGMSFEDASELGQMFGQESVIWKSPDGVVGAYYTDGSGRVNYALTPEGDLAVGEAAAPRIEERRPKEEKRGPPSPEDPWSKARGTAFEFGIDWDKTYAYDPTKGPGNAELAQLMVEQEREMSAGGGVAAALTVVSADELVAAHRA
jgi:hypothetical protein